MGGCKGLWLMNWPDFHQRFRELSEDHRSAPVAVECVVSGDAHAKELILRSGMTGESHHQLWPAPAESEADKPVWVYNTKPDEEPPEPERLGRFEHIHAWSGSDRALADFLWFAHEAGADLPDKEIVRARVPDEAPAACRWVFWLLHVLRDHRRQLVSIDKLTGTTGLTQEKHALRDAFTASLVAIDAMGLAEKPNQSASLSPSRQKIAAKIAEAMVLVKGNPDWSDRRIAKSVNVSPSTLSRNDLYHQAATMARQLGYDKPRGFFNSETGEADGVAE